jgi:aspartyl-tRNA(Asn)/glutamyl-tRNA(Gln) amidotransferase subunit A
VLIGKTNMDEFAMGSSTENSASRRRATRGTSSASPVAHRAGRQRLSPRGCPRWLSAPIRRLDPPARGALRHRRREADVRPGQPLRPGRIRVVAGPDRPLARSVEDAALLAGVLFGKDGRDATSADAAVPDFAGGARERRPGLRIGVPWTFLESGVDTGVKDAFEQGLRDLAAAGCRIVEIALPHAPHAIATYYIVATAEASSNLARFDGVRYGLRRGKGGLHETYGETRDQGFGPEVKRRILLGTFALSSGYYDAYYLRAQKVRTLIRRDFESALLACDAIATPTAPTAAFRLGEKTEDPLQMYLADVFTVPANLAGLPGRVAALRLFSRTAGRPPTRRPGASTKRRSSASATRISTRRGITRRCRRSAEHRRRRSRIQRRTRYASTPPTTPTTVLPRRRTATNTAATRPSRASIRLRTAL